MADPFTDGVYVVGRRSAGKAESLQQGEAPCSFVALAHADGRPIRGSRCCDYFTGVGHFDRATAEADRLQGANPSLHVRAFYGVSIEGAEEQMTSERSGGFRDMQAPG